jgi:hypothetical protein
MRPKSLPSATTLVKRLDSQSARRSFTFLYITNECNLTCTHCSFQSAPGKPETHLDTGLALHLIDELSGIHDITITGGEPLLHPGFPHILSHASHNASIVYVMTNGINLVGKERLKTLANNDDGATLKRILIKSMAQFPENLHLFFPLDSFHISACKQFSFLLRGLVEVAHEWNAKPERPYIGFLSNEMSQAESKKRITQYKAGFYTHIGTATFSPWRNAVNIYRWYMTHPLNHTPFPGGVYINYKGVYLSEAALLLDLREGIETPLKIGTLNPASRDTHQLCELYKRALHK